MLPPLIEVAYGQKACHLYIQPYLSAIFLTYGSPSR